MKQVIWISSVALFAAAVMTAQLKPKDPTQSPASQPAPKTATDQTYPAEQIQAGEVRFSSDCGFCHGRVFQRSSDRNARAKNAFGSYS